MSFTLQAGRIIAEARIQGVSGRRLIGGYQLHFGVELNIYPHTPDLFPLILTQWTAHVTCAGANADLHPLSPAHSEIPLALETFDFAHRTHVGFQLNLSSEQLAALEEQRREGDIRFELALSALASSVPGNAIPASREGAPVSPARGGLIHDSLSHRVGMSDWMRVLEQMGYGQRMIFAVDFPHSGAVTAGLRGAHMLLEQARERMLQGQYEAVVSLARKIMESIAASTGEAQQIRSAAQKYRESRETRESMTKQDRARLVQEAVRHYTHLAHHVGSDDGAPQWYSRSDAVFSLALAAAVVSDVSARGCEDEPPPAAGQ